MSRFINTKLESVSESVSESDLESDLEADLKSGSELIAEPIDTIHWL